MIDLTIAQNCIKTQREYGTYHGEKIGIVVKPCSGLVLEYSVGEVVLFTENEPMPNTPRTITIETPLSQEEICRERARGSLLTTIGTIVSVPAHFVEEVRV